MTHVLQSLENDLYLGILGFFNHDFIPLIFNQMTWKLYTLFKGGEKLFMPILDSLWKNANKMLLQWWVWLAESTTFETNQHVFNESLYVAITKQYVVQ
jgi:hypothetical protein